LPSPELIIFKEESSLQNQLIHLVADQLHLSFLILASQQDRHAITLMLVKAVVEAEVREYLLLL